MRNRRVSLGPNSAMERVMLARTSRLRPKGTGEELPDQVRMVGQVSKSLCRIEPFGLLGAGQQRMRWIRPNSFPGRSGENHDCRGPLIRPPSDPRRFDGARVSRCWRLDPVPRASRSLHPVPRFDSRVREDKGCRRKEPSVEDGSKVSSHATNGCSGPSGWAPTARDRPRGSRHVQYLDVRANWDSRRTAGREGRPVVLLGAGRPARPRRRKLRRRGTATIQGLRFI